LFLADNQKPARNNPFPLKVATIAKKKFITITRALFIAYSHKPSSVAKSPKSKNSGHGAFKHAQNRAKMKTTPKRKARGFGKRFLV
jgi:hypothetical protein